MMGRSYGMPEIDDDELEAELDALGDEIALDSDTSYLDDAVSAPSAPTGVPGADSVTNKVRLKKIVLNIMYLECFIPRQMDFFNSLLYIAHTHMYVHLYRINSVSGLTNQD